MVAPSGAHGDTWTATQHRIRRYLIVAGGAVAFLSATVTADAKVVWIASPSGNLECEVADRYAGVTNVLCQSFKRPQSVSMGPSGVLKICRGDRCLSNGPEGTVTLAYGKSRTVGRFRCTSLRSGMRCIVVAAEGIPDQPDGGLARL